MYRWKEGKKHYGLSVSIQGRFTKGRTSFQQMWMWRLCVLSSCHRTLVNIPSVSKHTNLKIFCSFVQTKPNRSGEHEGVGVCVCARHGLLKVFLQTTEGRPSQTTLVVSSLLTVRVEKYTCFNPAQMKQWCPQGCDLFTHPSVEAKTVTRDGDR